MTFANFQCILSHFRFFPWRACPAEPPACKFLHEEFLRGCLGPRPLSPRASRHEKRTCDSHGGRCAMRDVWYPGYLRCRSRGRTDRPTWCDSWTDQRWTLWLGIRIFSRTTPPPAPPPNIRPAQFASSPRNALYLWLPGSHPLARRWLWFQEKAVEYPLQKRTSGVPVKTRSGNQILWISPPDATWWPPSNRSWKKPVVRIYREITHWYPRTIPWCS